MLKLPIGLQNFQKLREEGYLYVDKTPLLYQLTTQNGYYFLSRPRHSGPAVLEKVCWFLLFLSFFRAIKHRLKGCGFTISGIGRRKIRSSI